MKSFQKLDAINQKIATLATQKKVLEDEIVQSVAKQVTAILIKEHATKTNVPELLEKIENIIDEIKNEHT